MAISNRFIASMGSVVGCIIAVASGCIDLAPSTQDEHIGLTYKQYCKLSSLRDFDPIGAESISTAETFERDSYDSWWKIEISRDDWLNICKQSEFGQPHPYNTKSNDVFGVPSTWPEPLYSAPDWWKPDSEFGSEILTSQEQWEDGSRATGWYWLYDDSSSTAIGWNWNRQYWNFKPYGKKSTPFDKDQLNHTAESWTD